MDLPLKRQLANLSKTLETHSKSIIILETELTPLCSLPKDVSEFTVVSCSKHALSLPRDQFRMARGSRGMIWK